MNKVYYRLYLDAIIALTRSIVIKLSDVAIQINNELSAEGVEVNADDPTTWLYYRHLAGEYHPIDTVMTVRSMDTLETIEFTKANMLIHRATAREYVPGTRYYNDLVSQYPEQVDLINGIINPVDIHKAIAAEDGEILYYNPTYIEDGESNLIPQLRVWVKRFIARWYNRQYSLSDDLYLSGFVGNLYAQLPLVIQNMRLANAFTPQAHSFHIREHLASHGRLDRYIPYLNRKQVMWLYRNIRFLERRVGHQKTFDALLLNLMTERRIPLTWYKLEQDVSRLPDNLRPDVEMVKTPLNYSLQPGQFDRESVGRILQREDALARGNSEIRVEAETLIVDRVSSDSFSTLPTKVHESEVVDRSNSNIRSLTDILLNHWVYLATNERYRPFVIIPSPATGENMTMSVKDAYIMFIYAFCKSRKIDIDYIPEVPAFGVLRETLPNQYELKELVDERYVSDGLIRAIQDRILPLGEYVSTERFYTACSELHTNYLRLWDLYSLREHYYSRVMCQQVVLRHFKNKLCKLVDTPTRFDDYMRQAGYPVLDLSDVEYDALMVDCFAIATGSNLVNRVTLAEIQRAMLGAMRELSSYSVQYLRNINESDIHYLGTPAQRLGDILAGSDSEYYLAKDNVTVLRLNASMRSRYSLGNQLSLPITRVRRTSVDQWLIDPTVIWYPKGETIANVRLNVSKVSVLSATLNINYPEPPDDLGHYQ